MNANEYANKKTGDAVQAVQVKEMFIKVTDPTCNTQAVQDDWLVTNADGFMSVCGPDEFQKTYRKVKEDE